jgi:hypothetical protein
MHKPFLATSLVFDIQYDPSYDLPRCMVNEQFLPKPVRVHPNRADPWSKQWGQPHLEKVSRHAWLFLRGPIES